MRFVGIFTLIFASAALLDSQEPAAKSPLAEARALLLKGEHAEARAEYAKLVADAAHGPAAAIGIARSWREQGDANNAARTLDDAIKAHLDNADLLAARADLHYDHGRWDEALADAAAAIKLCDGHFAARWTRARILRDSGKLDDAEQAMRWFVREYTAASNADRDITDPELLLIVGQAGAEHARWNNLSKQFSFIINEVYADALKFEPNLWQAECLIGDMLLEKYNRPEALTAYDKALTINPHAAEPRLGKARAAIQQYDLAEADAFINEALKSNPNLAAAHRLRADLHLMAGELAAAEESLNAALAVNPKDATALGKLAAVYTLRRQSINELEQRVASFDAKPAGFYQALGESLEERKRFDRAAECFEKAAVLRPKLAAPRTSLGMLHLRLGRDAEGRKLLDAAFQADKFNVRVANMRKVLEHLDRYDTLKTAHYEIRFDPSRDRLLAEFIAEHLEETHAELKRQFKYEPPGQVPILIFSRHDMFSGRTIGLPDLHTIGACTGGVVAMASPTAVGVKKPFNWGRVIRHELTHIFNLAQTNFQCPHWFTEGLAVRNEGIEHPHIWTKVLQIAESNGTLFSLDTITRGFVRPRDQAEWTLAYCQSHLYVEYLASRHGEEAFARLLAAYAEGLDDDAALRRACGVDKAEFEAGYRAFIKVWLVPFHRVASKPDKAATLSVAEVQQALTAEPDDPDLKARLAEYHLQRRENAAARKLADEALAKSPGHPRAAMIRSRLLQLAGDTEGAIETLNAALEEDGDNPRLLLALGRVELESKNIERAAEVFERGRKVAPLDGDWLEQLARIYDAAEQSEKLVSVLEEIAAHDPDDLASRIRLAGLLLKAGDAKQALTFARQAIQIDVNSDEARQVLLECLKKTGGNADEMQRRFQLPP